MAIRTRCCISLLSLRVNLSDGSYLAFETHQNVTLRLDIPFLELFFIIESFLRMLFGKKCLCPHVSAMVDSLGLAILRWVSICQLIVSLILTMSGVLGIFIVALFGYPAVLVLAILAGIPVWSLFLQLNM